MAIRLTSTREAATLHGLKILVSGLAGAGKTSLCATTGGNPIIISAEAGLLSLRHTDIPVLTVSTMAEVEEAYAYLLSPEGAQYDWVCLDSISEIAEVVLTKEKAATKDPRQAYGALSDQMGELIRAFRDLPERNVYMTAKMERTKDETTGRLIYGPSFPGQRLSQQVGYWFDEVFVLRTEQDSDGVTHRYLQTASDLQYTAKDRSGALGLYEVPDLAAIAAKIRQPSIRAAA
jgi:hypothetical protein